MEVAPLGDGDVRPVAVAVAGWQAEPVSHVVFVGEEPDVIAAEFAAEPRWRERTFVARDGDEIVGVVLAAVDDDMGRVWWYGPWGSPHEAREAVLEAASAAMPSWVTEEEFGPDRRNHAVAALAEQRGCIRNTGSYVLSMDPLVAPDVAPVAGVTVHALASPGAGALADDAAALHDLLFPGTHTTGARLVAAERTSVLVAVDDDGSLLGYVASDVQADGTGYVDFIGTAPAARRRGVARALLAEQLRRWAAAGVAASNLTVREDSEGAQALYEGLGYVTVRTIAPWRRGFDLG